jgi:hypothetical protein
MRQQVVAFTVSPAPAWVACGFFQVAGVPGRKIFGAGGPRRRKPPDWDRGGFGEVCSCAATAAQPAYHRPPGAVACQHEQDQPRGARSQTATEVQRHHDHNEDTDADRYQKDGLGFHCRGLETSWHCNRGCYMILRLPAFVAAAVAVGLWAVRSAVHQVHSPSSGERMSMNSTLDAMGQATRRWHRSI